MLKPMNGGRAPRPIKLADAAFPAPFAGGLEYNPPARGVWNIVHTAMLIPESHQIYVCAQGCLRGVILTAAEMNAMERMSWVSLREQDMWSGEMEQRVVEGCSHIIDRLPRHPRCITVFLSCMHIFEGCDFRVIQQSLSERYPDIDFVDCYMIPTMRKAMSPEAMMYRQLYKPVKKLPADNSLVGLTGTQFAFEKTSELFDILSAAGKRTWELPLCESYEEYLSLGGAEFCISTQPTAYASVKELNRTLGIDVLYLPLCYGYDEIESCYDKLCERLGIARFDTAPYREAAEKALASLKETLGDREISIDHTATPRPLGLALLLYQHGFNVRSIYSDVFIPEERAAFDKLKALGADIDIFPTLDAAMTFVSPEPDSSVLAIGQKAAYFNNTDRFADIVYGGGLYGFGGIVSLCKALEEAARVPKDTRKVISHKGWGCESCL